MKFPPRKKKVQQSESLREPPMTIRPPKWKSQGLASGRKMAGGSCQSKLKQEEGDQQDIEGLYATDSSIGPQGED